MASDPCGGEPQFLSDLGRAKRIVIDKEAYFVGDVEMDVGESLSWMARSMLDGYVRGMCGMEGGDTLNVPLRIFTKASATCASGEPPSSSIARRAALSASTSDSAGSASNMLRAAEST